MIFGIFPVKFYLKYNLKMFELYENMQGVHYIHIDIVTIGND